MAKNSCSTEINVVSRFVHDSVGMSVWNIWEYERVQKGQKTGAGGQKVVVIQRRFILQFYSRGRPRGYLVTIPVKNNSRGCHWSFHTSGQRVSRWSFKKGYSSVMVWKMEMKQHAKQGVDGGIHGDVVQSAAVRAAADARRNAACGSF